MFNLIVHYLEKYHSTVVQHYSWCILAVPAVSLLPTLVSGHLELEINILYYCTLCSSVQ